MRMVKTRYGLKKLSAWLLTIAMVITLIPAVSLTVAGADIFQGEAQDCS